MLVGYAQLGREANTYSGETYVKISGPDAKPDKSEAKPDGQVIYQMHV